MEKIRKKINLALVIFGIIVVALLAFLFTYLKPVNVNQDDNIIVESRVAPISQEELDSNYQEQIKAISNETFNLASDYYFKIASSTTADDQFELNNLSSALINSLAEIKIRAIDMRVPDAKRNTHLSFVMLIDDLKNALDNNDNENYKENYTFLLELQKEIP